MKYKSFNYKDFIEDYSSSLKIISLLSNKESRLNIVYMERGEMIPSHHSSVDVCIYVIEGKLELIFNRLDNCICKACKCDYFDENEVVERRYLVKDNQLFLFDKNVVHTISALRKSFFFIIKI